MLYSLYRRSSIKFLILLLWLAIQGSDAEENGILSTILEAEKTLEKHAHLDLVVLEKELHQSLDDAHEQIRQRVAATIEERAISALHNRQQIETTIAELETILAAVNRQRAMEKNNLVNEELFKQQVQQIEREENERILNSISTIIHTVVNATDFSTPCLTALVAAQAVHKALTTKYIGQPDLLQTPGTKIVHQFTSPTYDPPSRVLKLRLRDWRRYIPDDWEAILPNDWKIPNLIPSHVWHSLGLSGFGASAPPQAILQPPVQPGNCWPSARPKVVIQLATPAILSGITIDHVPEALVEHRSSAPKHIRVFSYSPATDGANRDGLTFDRSSRKLLLEGEFDVSSGSSSVQSFSVDQSLTEHHGDSSCGTVSPSCTSGITMISAAIEVEVLSNWGNSAYTCLYRVRAHGNVTY